MAAWCPPLLALLVAAELAAIEGGCDCVQRNNGCKCDSGDSCDEKCEKGTRFKECGGNALRGNPCFKRSWTSFCCTCGAGQFKAAESQGDYSCDDCPKNTYSQADKWSPFYLTSCADCPANSNADKKSDSFKDCKSNAGYYIEGDLVKPCPANTYKDSSQYHDYACYNCPAGTITNGTTEVARIACLPAAGQTGAAGAIATACTSGKYKAASFSVDACTSCSAGKYGSSSGQTSESSCVSCVAGTFTDQAGQTYCISCAAGKYKDQAAQTSDNCISCVAGKHASATSAASSCTDCVVGKYKDQSAQSSDTCISCMAGKYKGSVAQPSDTCISCMAGKYKGSAAQPSDTCISCAAGKYKDQAAQTSDINCISCVAGKHAPATSAASCTGCVAGKYKGSAAQSSDTCISCVAGKYKGSVAQSSDTCISCAAGKYKDQAAQTSDNCITCVAGKHASATSAAEFCALCPSNSNSSAASNSDFGCLAGPGYSGSGSRLAACAIGKFKSVESDAACELCGEGQYQDSTASTECVACSSSVDPESSCFEGSDSKDDCVCKPLFSGDPMRGLPCHHSTIPVLASLLLLADSDGSGTFDSPVTFVDAGGGSTMFEGGRRNYTANTSAVDTDVSLSLKVTVRDGEEAFLLRSGRVGDMNADGPCVVVEDGEEQDEQLGNGTAAKSVLERSMFTETMAVVIVRSAREPAVCSKYAVTLLPNAALDIELSEEEIVVIGSVFTAIVASTVAASVAVSVVASASVSAGTGSSIPGGANPLPLVGVVQQAHLMGASPAIGSKFGAFSGAVAPIALQGDYPSEQVQDGADSAFGTGASSASGLLLAPGGSFMQDAAARPLVSHAMYTLTLYAIIAIGSLLFVPVVGGAMSLQIFQKLGVLVLGLAFVGGVKTTMQVFADQSSGALFTDPVLGLAVAVLVLEVLSFFVLSHKVLVFGVQPEWYDRAIQAPPVTGTEEEEEKEVSVEEAEEEYSAALNIFPDSASSSSSHRLPFIDEAEVEDGRALPAGIDGEEVEEEEEEEEGTVDEGSVGEGLTQLRSAFATFDTDGSGALNKSEFKEIMTMGEAAFTDDEFEELFSLVDTDRSNLISFDEYVAWALPEQVLQGVSSMEPLRSVAKPELPEEVPVPGAPMHIRKETDLSVPIEEAAGEGTGTESGTSSGTGAGTGAGVAPSPSPLAKHRTHRHQHFDRTKSANQPKLSLTKSGRGTSALQRTKSAASLKNARDIDPAQIRQVVGLDIPAGQRVVKLFQIFDVDQSGYLERGEIERLLLAIGFELLPADFDDVMDLLDTTQDGQVEVEELSAWVSSNEGKHAAIAKQRGSNRARLGCLATFSAFFAAGCPCASSTGSNADNVMAGAFAAQLFSALCGVCCRQRFKRMFAPRGKWSSDPLFSTLYGGMYEILTYSGRFYGMWPLYKIILQVSVIIFLPRSQAVLQLSLLMCCELVAMVILYGSNSCGNPVHVNRGEHTVAVTGCWIQLAFLVLPTYAAASNTEPNGSLMVYITILAIVVQLLVIAIKTALIVKALCKKKVVTKVRDVNDFDDTDEDDTVDETEEDTETPSSPVSESYGPEMHRKTDRR